MRRILVFVLITIMYNVSTAQEDISDATLEKKGLSFGCSLGAGSLHTFSNAKWNTLAAATLPNLKLGYHFSPNFTLYVLLPGTPYKAKEKVRSLEGILLAAQYWPLKKWWILAGLGASIDAPAFWTVKNPAEANFKLGFPGLAAGMGHVFWRKEKFYMDMQLRIYSGNFIAKENDISRGFTNMLSIGINWN